MTSKSRAQQSATIIPFPVQYRAPASAQESQQQADLIELRWQKEWERRNVED
jgi:hypothetical protein